MNSIDLHAVAAAAATYPDASYRAEIQSEMWLQLATGATFEDAQKRAFCWADRERKGDRGRVSLDTLLSEYGDAIRLAALPCPSRTASARRVEDHRAGGSATPRHEEKGIGELDEATLDYLVSVLTNLVERNVLEVDPLTCAIDARALDGALRRAVLAVVQSATRREMTEAGISRREQRSAEAWLSSYARLRPDLTP
jgi:hypothetical protein